MIGVGLLMGLEPVTGLGGLLACLLLALAMYALAVFALRVRTRRS